MGSLAKGFLRNVLRKFCRKFAETCKNAVYCVRKECGNSAENQRKYFCNNPFPNDPISELLKCGSLTIRLPTPARMLELAREADPDIIFTVGVPEAVTAKGNRQHGDDDVAQELQS